MMRMEYEESLKVYRDLINVIDTAEWKRRLKERLSNARKMKEEGLDIAVISRITGLSANEIKNAVGKSKTTESIIPNHICFK